MRVMAASKLFSLFSAAPETRNSYNQPDHSEALSLLNHFEESCKGWFWSTDEAGHVKYISDSVAPFLNSAPGKLAGLEFADLFVPADPNASARERLSFLLCRHSNFEKLVLKAANAQNGRWWEVSGSPQFDGSGEFCGYRGYGVDVTEQLASSEQASQLALYDPLTGLPNRLSMTNSLQSGLAGIDLAGRSCAVILIDLDRFKQVNDSLGHPAGDALLIQVSERLLKIIGDREKVFRLGGDEFQIILPNCDDRDMLAGIADEIIETLTQPYSIDGVRCIIGASIGMVIGPADGRTSDEMMRNGDLALYAAKANGRGCYQFFSGELLEAVETRRVLEEDLRDALAKGQLSLFYQPLVSTKSSCVTGVEALIRWHHPTRGAISPALFIPIAEEADLIGKLGEWILRKACDDAAGWPAEIRVAVNVSPLQFANEGLPQIVLSALANSGLSPGRLELEITEGVFLNESSETDAMFSRLKDLGVRLALDDFGTGYSSLSYLKTAPFDKIKIDQSFVREATHPASRNRAIIAAIVALAGALDMETTAEGVETLDQLDLIKNLGVSHIQGYVYSKAIPSDDLALGLENGEWRIEPSGPAKQRSKRRAMYRKVGAIMGGYYHAALIRNLSETGALIEGLKDVPLGAQMIVDFGEGQLSVGTVRRTGKRQLGIEFSDPLIDDGVGGLRTGNRVAPYTLAKMGLSPSDHLGETRPWSAPGEGSLETVTQTLGLKLHGEPTQTASKFQNLTLMGTGLNLGGRQHRQVTLDEWERLKAAVEASHNPSLKFIIGLVVMTGARLQELLIARWDDINVGTQVWMVPKSNAGEQRRIHLPADAVKLINQLPKWEGCPYLIVNPATKKPYRTFFGSWDAARTKAGLATVSINDIRSSGIKSW